MLAERTGGIPSPRTRRSLVPRETKGPLILGQTQRGRVFPTVANLGIRSPAMLAKAVASLDHLSGGRFELGLGTGGFREPIVEPPARYTDLLKPFHRMA